MQASALALAGRGSAHMGCGLLRASELNVLARPMFFGEPARRTRPTLPPLVINNPLYNSAIIRVSSKVYSPNIFV